MQLSALRQLLECGSAALGDTRDLGNSDRAFLRHWGAQGMALAHLLELRNGFFAFESSLLVRAMGSIGPPLDLVAWNAIELWKGRYANVSLEGLLFFAEDAFATQFAIERETMVVFDLSSARCAQIRAQGPQSMGSITEINP